MVVKKVNGKIFGADFSAAERKALHMEAGRTFAEYDRRNAKEIDAMVLWVLRSEFGWGETRLKRFHDSFIPAINDLCSRYEMFEEGDRIWLCTQKLKDSGIDMDKWNT